MNLNVFFDVMLIGTCLAPGYYLLRTLRQIYSYEELSMLKYEWVPILFAGFFFALWVVESAYFDFTDNFSAQTSGVRDATLFASVSIFAIGTARFAGTWGGYVKRAETMKKMQEAVRDQARARADPVHTGDGRGAYPTRQSPE